MQPLYQAVILAGGEEKNLFPLTSGGMIKALLPIANQPLLSYPLRTLEQAGLKSVIVVVIGDKAANAVGSWISQHYASPDRLACEVVSVPEEYGTADALRAVASRITSPTFVVLAGDLLIDLPVNALVASHQLHAATATMVLTKRRVSPSTETKPGKAPKNVDYIGLDAARERLLFYASSPDALRDLRIPMASLRTYGSMTIATHLTDAHLYIFSRTVLEVLADQPKLASLRQDMLPFLARQQACAASLAQAAALGAVSQVSPRQSAGGSLLQGAACSSGNEAGPSGNACVTPAVSFKGGQAGNIGDALASGLGSSLSLADDAMSVSDQMGPGHAALPGASYMTMSHSQTAQGTVSQRNGGLRVHLVEEGGGYCQRVHDLQTYGEVNREVADPTLALHLSGLRPSKYDNIVSASAVLGNKTTVASACIIGDSCMLGDKTSIKRSVLGANVKLGTNVKVINSVILDGVVVGDGAHIQNSIVCPGANVQAGATLKDCQVGPGFTVAGGVEYKSDTLVTLAKTK